MVRSSEEAERLCLMLMLAVADGKCEERVPVILDGVAVPVIADAIHKLAHVLVGLHRPDDLPTARGELRRKLAALIGTQLWR